MFDKLLVDDAHSGTSDDSSESSREPHSEIGGEATTRSAILTATADRYYALSACCALFRYLERSNNRAFASRSLRIRYAAPEGESSFESPRTRASADMQHIQAPSSSTLTLRVIWNSPQMLLIASRMIRCLVSRTGCIHAQPLTLLARRRARSYAHSHGSSSAHHEPPRSAHRRAHNQLTS